MSGASDATTEQYFSSERSIARRAFTSSAPPPGQPQIESIVFEVIHGVVLEQPVECGAIVKLDAHHEVGPEGRAIRIGTAGVVAYEAESPAGVGRRRLVVTGEAVQSFEAADVAVDAIEHADFSRGPDS